MVAEEINLSAELMDRTHPFHLALDPHLTIRQAGSALGRLLDKPIVGTRLGDLFQILSPPPALEFDRLFEADSGTLTLEALSPPMRLSGPLLPIQEEVTGRRWLLFLGRPCVSDAAHADSWEARLQPYVQQQGIGESLRTLQAYKQELQHAQEDADRQRLESEDFYRGIINSLSQIVFQADAEGRFTFLNNAWKTVTGFSVEATLGRLLADFVLAEDQEIHREQMALLTEEIRDECRYLVRIGTLYYGAADIPLAETVRWVGVNIRTVRDSVGTVTGYSGTLTDITERKRAEQDRADALNERAKALSEREVAQGALRENEAYLRTVMASAPLVLFAQNSEGVFTLFEGRGAEAMGATTEQEIVGQTGCDIFADQPEFCRQFQCALRGEDFTSIIDRGTHVLEARYSPICLPDGTLNGFIGIATDITERVRADERLRDLALDLQRSNQVLQDFASVASHDLQEPLRKIQAFGGRLKRSLGEKMDAEPADYLDRMLASAGRMQMLINDLLAFSRITTKGRPFEPVDMNEVAARVLGDLEARIQRYHGKVILEMIPTIEADALQMRQLLQNLIINGLKFHRDGIPPVVYVRAQILREAERGGRVVCRLLVEDNGVGFEEKYRERVFEVFEKLHSKGEFEGTGMGLAICRKIVERHGGEITARSAPGIGSTFSVTLPVKPDVSGGVSSGADI